MYEIKTNLQKPILWTIVLLVLFVANGCGVPSTQKLQPTQSCSTDATPTVSTQPIPDSSGVFQPLSCYSTTPSSNVSTQNKEAVTGLLYIAIDNTESIQRSCGGKSRDRIDTPEYILSLFGNLPNPEPNTLIVRVVAIGASNANDVDIKNILPVENDKKWIPARDINGIDSWKQWMDDPDDFEDDGDTNYAGVFNEFKTEILDQGIPTENVLLWVITDGAGIASDETDAVRNALSELSDSNHVQTHISILCPESLSTQEKNAWNSINSVGYVEVDLSGEKNNWITDILSKDTLLPFLPQNHAWIFPGSPDYSSHTFQKLSGLSIYTLNWYLLGDDDDVGMQATWAGSFPGSEIAEHKIGKFENFKINFPERSQQCQAPDITVQPYNNNSRAIGFAWLDEDKPEISMKFEKKTSQSINFNRETWSVIVDFSQANWHPSDIRSKAECLSLCPTFDMFDATKDNINLFYHNTNGDVTIFSAAEQKSELKTSLQVQPKNFSGSEKKFCFATNLINVDSVLATDHHCIDLLYRPRLYSWWNKLNILACENQSVATEISSQVGTSAKISTNIVEFSFSTKYTFLPQLEPLGSFVLGLKDGDLLKANENIDNLSVDNLAIGCPTDSRLLLWNAAYPDPKPEDGYFVCKYTTGANPGEVEYRCKTYEYIVDYCQAKEFNFKWGNVDNYLEQSINCTITPFQDKFNFECKELQP